jgi:hypothetical protein
MQKGSKVGDRARVLRDSPDETHTRKEEKAMNKNLARRAIRLGALIVLVGWASWAPAAPKPPNDGNVAHACQVTVADGPGNSITGDPGVVYTDGVNAEARLWDMGNGVADHLYFVAALKLSIPGVTDGVQTCDLGILQPNVNVSGYQFYDDLPLYQSTTGDQNFGGLFQCRFGSGNRDRYSVTYESQCIVITHTDDKLWTITAPDKAAGCTAAVAKVLKSKVVDQWVNQSVPFEVQAMERD